MAEHEDQSSSHVTVKMVNQNSLANRFEVPIEMQALDCEHKPRSQERDLGHPPNTILKIDRSRTKLGNLLDVIEFSQ
jgi:hypothetical protein